MKLALLMRPSGVQTEQSDKVKFKLGVAFTLLMIKDELGHFNSGQSEDEDVLKCFYFWQWAVFDFTSWKPTLS